MSKAIRLFSFIVISLFVSSAAMAATADNAKLQPQEWQKINVGPAQGTHHKLDGHPGFENLPHQQTLVGANNGDYNLVESQGMPQQAAMLMPAELPEAQNEATLGYLNNSGTFAFLEFASIFIVAGLFILFVLFNGISRLEKGFSGKLIKRWSGFSISIHWLGAISCIALIFTGLVLGLGRFYIEPSTNVYGWAGLVGIASSLHGLMAWPFIVGYVLMVLAWFPKQMPASYDLKWFAKLGGYLNFGKKVHPDAGFANAGEKLFFWTFAIGGGLMVASGLVMMYPETFDVSKNAANLMLAIHITATIIISAFAVVHFFMATVMSEGSMSNMTTGYCDENWAKQHHNVWYKELKDAGKV
ncbi:formate dehydrogenase subunit gamma [Shewanella intestini]|uniref:Formate dehydrogenase subunit gamma n=1 Tax=Shewanella intestini TaxID=2017544 RepID=A0ABS5I3A7_9GAMM|nr:MULTISPECIES: formate dehydrogenase subunit gamma [Shewanella]MBR9728159.1 formate dehydrogenase subunit gamma [Shewanella intestini]MRG36630.1 formate dehydrogenase subunit gamma [Shewanella sp. XMDDZSB0408]